MLLKTANLYLKPNNMKITTLTLAFLFAMTSFTFAQRTINASEIIQKMNEGIDVRYENVEIEGVLDFTDLKNRQLVEEENNWFGNDNKHYESQVEVAVEFVKCTFRNDVLAYYNEDNSTYIANFEDDVIFRQCSFRGSSEFKYSEFPGTADFSNTIFLRDANFKYAEFSQGPNFKSSVFEEEANFKYADFPDGVSFEGSVFNELANFKYSKISEPLNLQDVVFNGNKDFKYTKVEGKDFTSYLLNNR